MTVLYYYHRENDCDFMIQSVCYWAKEYHIDGFRFDLMGLHDTKTMNNIRTALRNICLRMRISA